MKKKSIAFVLSLLLASSLVACGSESADNEKGSEGRGTVAEAVSEDEEAAAEEEEKEEIEDEEEAAEESVSEYSFEPFTVEADCCSVTFKEISNGGWMGYTIKATLENNSDDVTYMFAVEDAYADGLACDPFWAAEVAPGKKSNEEIMLDSDALERLGTDPTQIELYFKIYNTDDWSEDAIFEDVVTIYPYGEDKTTVYQREEESTDQILVENEDISVSIVEVKEDDIWGYTLVLYLQNNTDKNLMYAVEDVSVNGFMADPFWASSVKCNKTKYSALSWSKETLEENEIDEIEEVTMTVRAYDENDWAADAYVSETITFTP